MQTYSIIHISLSQVSYVVSFVNSEPDLHSAAVSAVL